MVCGRPRAGAWIETSCLRLDVAANHVAPARGRGLKHGDLLKRCRRSCVAPARGRGLKHGDGRSSGGEQSVAPARGRGLKPLPEEKPDAPYGRPRAGAWIETVSASPGLCAAPRRPRAGAWIETPMPCITGHLLEVAPARGRGLKHVTAPRTGRRAGRPRAGAWIETLCFLVLHCMKRSPPRGGVD